MNLKQYYRDPQTLITITQLAVKEIAADRGNRSNLQKLELLEELNRYAKRLIIRRGKP